MRLNSRHKTGLFLTLLVVGLALLAGTGTKEALGVGLVGLAATLAAGAVKFGLSVAARRCIATALITVFALVTLSLPTTVAQNPLQRGDIGGAVTRLLVAVLVLAGLFWSARWRVRLAGHTYKPGKQALAILLAFYCALAFLIDVTMSATDMRSRGFDALDAIRAAVGLVFALGSLASLRWSRQLRKQERLALAAPGPQGAASGGGSQTTP